MSEPTADFAASYQQTLEKYVESGEEHQLEEAFALGREAFADGVTLLSLLDLHRTSVENLLRRGPTGDGRTGDGPAGDGPGRKAAPKTASTRIDASFQMLAEALATFEMAQRGYWEAQERARWEHQQSVLRERLTQAYMAVDRASLAQDERLAAIERAVVDLVDGCKSCKVFGIDDPGAPSPTDPGTFAIRNPRGQGVALLHVDVGDESLSDDQRYLLTEFTLMAGVALENSRQFAREQHIASMLQRELLPAALPSVPGLDVALRYLPGEPGSHAGGDWYDVFELDDGRVGLVVGDITGHGVAAAAAMGQLRIAVLAYALAGYEPEKVLEHVDLLIARMESSTIATMVYALVDLQACELTLVNAGHPPPIVVAGGASRRLLEGHARLLGVSPPLSDRDQRLVELRSGSHVLLYTDGLLEPTERAGGDGVGRLQDITDGFSGTADQLCDLVLAEMAPEGTEDDTCILVATLLP